MSKQHRNRNYPSIITSYFSIMIIMFCVIATLQHISIIIIRLHIYYVYFHVIKQSTWEKSRGKLFTGKIIFFLVFLRNFLSPPSAIPDSIIRWFFRKAVKRKAILRTRKRRKIERRFSEDFSLLVLSDLSRSALDRCNFWKPCLWFTEFSVLMQYTKKKSFRKSVQLENWEWEETITFPKTLVFVCGKADEFFFQWSWSRSVHHPVLFPVNWSLLNLNLKGS